MGLSRSFGCTGGLYAAEAIQLLQRFYFQGNPRGDPLSPHPLASGRIHAGGPEHGLLEFSYFHRHNVMVRAWLVVTAVGGFNDSAALLLCSARAAQSPPEQGAGPVSWSHRVVVIQRWLQLCKCPCVSCRAYDHLFTPYSFCLESDLISLQRSH